jgi:hypothetical protein
LQSSSPGHLATAIALALGFYALHPASFDTLSTWSHTSFNFPLGTVFLLVLLRVAWQGGLPSWRVVALLGVAAGLLTAVMINFLPWVVGLAVYVWVANRTHHEPANRTWTALLIIAVTGAIGFVVGVLPAAGRFPYFAGWIVQLISHQLPYGIGPEGVTTPALLLSNFLAMLRAAPALFLAMTLGIAVYVYARVRRLGAHRTELWPLATALVVQMLVELALVLKHPGERFLLSIAATLPVLALIELVWIEPYVGLRRVTKTVLVALTALALALFFRQSLAVRQAAVSMVDEQQAAVRQALDTYSGETGRSPSDVVLVWTVHTVYRHYSPCYALLYADVYTNGAFTDEVSRLCPHQAVFDNLTNLVLYNGEQYGLPGGRWDVLVTNANVLAYRPDLKTAGELHEYLGGLFVVFNTSH